MPRTLNIITPAFFALAIMLTYPKMLQDPDIGWHFEAGRWILQNLTIPYLNPFSYTSANYQWMNISWLWDVLIWSVYNIAGVGGAIILIVSLSFFALQTSLSTKYRSPIAYIITALMGFLMLELTLSVRPQMLAYLIIAVFMRECLREKPRISILAGLMVLWANVHGSFLLGFTILAALWLTNRKNFLLAALACTFATLLNPLGLGLYEAAFRTLGGELATIITEWQPMELFSITAAVLFLISALLAVNFKSLDKGYLLLVIFWMIMSINSVRYASYLFFLAAPLIAEATQNLLDKNKRIVTKNAEFTADFIRFDKNIVPVSVVSLLIFAICAAVALPSATLPEKIYPNKEMAFTMQNYPDVKFLNSYNLGGPIIFLSHGKLKTFIDGRAETAFSPSVAHDYIAFHNNKDWTHILAKYKIDGLFLTNEDAKSHSKFFSKHPEWRLVYKGEVARVYVLSAPNIHKSE